MKTNSKHSRLFHLMQPIFAIYFLVILCAFTTPEEKSKVSSFIKEYTGIYLPDTVYEDTLVFQEGDTIETYYDGSNMVYILYEDTSATQDTLEMEMWTFEDNQPNILIELSDTYGEIQQGLFGMNLTNFFLPRHANPEDLEEVYDDDPTPHDYLSDLRPNVLRYPAGAAGTFMNPLGSERTLDDENPDFGWRNGGYGYDIEEMISYFDMADGIPNVFTPPIYDMPDLIAALEIDFFEDAVPADKECDDCDEWMGDGGGIAEAFRDTYLTWHDQTLFNPLDEDFDELKEQPLYINDFLRLVEKIEDENEGHVVDVIYCADILGQTATEVVEVINYMKSNEIYNVNVVGVELGNEMFSSTFCELVGFCDDEFVSDFDHYYNFINGDNYDGLAGWSTSDLEDALADDVEIDHDFIDAIRNDEGTYNIKIGLPAAAHRNCAEYIFIVPEEEGEGIGGPLGGGGPCPYPAWNDSMVPHYDDMIYSDIAEDDMYTFDAVIIHNYLGADNGGGAMYPSTNFGQIIVPDGDNCLDGDYGDLDPDIYGGAPPVAWDFSSPDERLDCTYYGLIGQGNLPGNFHYAIKNSIYDAQEDHANHMAFLATDDGPEVKEQWVTEYSVRIDGDPALSDFYGVVANSFMQAYVTQEWIMKNIKMNFTAAARPGFFTYATMQNFLGAVPTDLMTGSDKQDQVSKAMIGCSGSKTDDYYMPRAVYHTMNLLKNVFDGDMKFLGITTTMYSGNPNLPPTAFVHQTAERLIIVYSNVRPTTQTYYIDPDLLEGIYAPGTDIDLNDHSIYIHSIDAAQLYSTAGKSSLFDINTFYDACSTGYVNRFEIEDISTELNTGTCAGGWGVADGVCVKVPANSAGYFEIEMELYRLGEAKDIYRIFPNPASTEFTISYTDAKFDQGQPVIVEIFSIEGHLMHSSQIMEFEKVDISNFPVGVYQIILSQVGMQTESEMLVKMK